MFLFWYPLRHIYWGLDLWDTGYNYANFLYMDLDHMDSMWLFSTYLANAAGHFLTMLPGAGGLAGMNLYTGLFVSVLAIMGYLFCTRKLGISRGIAFLGELAAVSLCWCPTALLYNYLTYILFLICIILLYVGLTEEKNLCLFAAGICLGSNVLVRFSNLPEAALIVAVWAWDIIGGRERRETRQAGRQMMKHTLYCLGGYLSALAVLFVYIHFRYGFAAYVEGIRRLFAMTDNATDYKASAMIMGVVGTYVENLYWVVRIAAIILAGMAGFAVLGLVKRRAGAKSGRWCLLWTVVCGVMALALAGVYYGKIRFLAIGVCGGLIKIGVVFLVLMMLFAILGFTGGWLKSENGIWRVARLVWCGMAALMLVWLYSRGFCSLEFRNYGSILRPGILFLMLAMMIALLRFLHPKSPREEKLISVMVILVVLLTSLGSNNDVYPSLNNLFVAGPYTLWQCWRFVRNVKVWNREKVRGKKIVLSAFPVKAVLTAFLAMFLFQSTVFGVCFVFVEATGAQDITTVIDNNEVLAGVKMSPERALWMSGISEYVNEKGLRGREVILFGQVPALSYYLQMPSAFNAWSDLRSYSYEKMEQDMEELSDDVESGDAICPVIILEREYTREYEAYLEGGEGLLQEMGVDAKRIEWITGTEGKYMLLKTFIEKFNYDSTYENEKFLLYETDI